MFKYVNWKYHDYLISVLSVKFYTSTIIQGEEQTRLWLIVTSMELDQIWFQFQEYEETNEQKNLLGSLIVFAMVKRFGRLRIKYKRFLESNNN